MNYCYTTMRTAAMNDPHRIKIGIDEFLNRLDIWFMIADSTDELEEIILGLMDGLSDEQIKFYTQKCFTKKQMTTLRIMITNGVSAKELNKVADSFKNITDYSKYQFGKGSVDMDTMIYLDRLNKSHHQKGGSVLPKYNSNFKAIKDDDGEIIIIPMDGLDFSL